MTITRLRKISTEEHNKLVGRIADAGFLVPELNKTSKLMVGHINVKNPKPDHPMSSPCSDHSLPVAYIGYGHFDLVNTDELALKEYHSKLKSIVEGEQ